MSDMICPFCGQKLESFFVENRSVFACCNMSCNGYFMNAPKELWQELIRTKELLDIQCAEHSMCHTKMLKTTEKLGHTRKALDVANEKLRHCVNITVEELDELKGNLLIAYNALLHFSKDPIANNALKKITALVQKDVK